MDFTTLYHDLNLQLIDDFISEKREENLYLEFKTANSAEMSREDRRNFAKALSGFANSSGGLLVWGVVAEKDSQGIDCACDKRVIENLPLFMSKLNEYTGQLVSPILSNVEHRAIQIDSNRGFVASLIPESDGGPHMAKGGEDRYYKRGGDSFYKMEHFDIADMFGRRKRPELALHTEIHRGGHRGGPQGLTFQGVGVVGIKNSGRGTAKAPMLGVKVHPPFTIDQFGLDGNHNFGIPRLNRGASSDFEYFGSNNNAVIHPGTIFNIAKVKIEIHESKIDQDDLLIEWQIAAEDIDLFTGETRISASQLADTVCQKSK